MADPYARALALWCEFLAVYELAWDAMTVEDLGGSSAGFGPATPRRWCRSATTGRVSVGDDGAADAGGLLVLPLPQITETCALQGALRALARTRTVDPFLTIDPRAILG
jgi:hypothetical protein